MRASQSESLTAWRPEGAVNRIVALPRAGTRFLSLTFRRERSVYAVFLLPAVAMLFLITVYPLLYGLAVSFTDLQLARPRQAVFVGVSQYVEMARSAHFRITVTNTLLFIVGAVGGQMVLGLGLALLLNRGLPGFAVVRTLMLLPMTIPTVVSSLAWYSMYNPTYGIINFVLARLGIYTPPLWLADPRTALVSVVLVDIWQWTPFVMLVLLAGLHTLPEEHVEAAAVEGAGAFQIFRYITLPYLRPFLGVALLFRTIDAFKVFDKIYILTGGGPGTATETVNFFAYRQGFAFSNMGYASAISVFILLTVVALSVTIIRQTQRLREA